MVSHCYLVHSQKKEVNEVKSHRPNQAILDRLREEMKQLNAQKVMAGPVFVLAPFVLGGNKASFAILSFRSPCFLGTHISILFFPSLFSVQYLYIHFCLHFKITLGRYYIMANILGIKPRTCSKVSLQCFIGQVVFQDVIFIMFTE